MFYNSTLVRSLKCYQWIFSLMCLSAPPPIIYAKDKNSFTHYACFLIYIIYTIALATIAIYTTFEHNAIVEKSVIPWDLDAITVITSLLHFVCLMATFIWIQLKSFLGLPQLREIIAIIAELEQQLNRQCPQMCCNRKYNRRILLTSGLSLLILICVTMYTNYYLIANTLHFKVKIFVLFFIVCLEAKFLEFGLYIQAIYLFLETLYDSLKALYAQQPDNCLVRLNKLIKIQMTLNQVWLFSKKLENYFAISILLIFLFNALTVLTTVNWAYVRSIIEPKDPASLQLLRLCYTWVLVLNMLLLCSLSQRCLNKVSSFSEIIIYLTVFFSRF